ncbi:mitochondrial translation protein [Penicillium verhagenii]|uniref:mitochondrial translation protein n=1 Tax=Penicillium verhagenii TaxID=1562060 RepID=UPI00254523E7|nr:mitochondrial translation protein [Penicillium verhagenii]KAJ5921502.1 mitochondrial translation protein [Penicillium verhagenii]
MFRASFRAVADPVREHICLSCRIRRYDAPSTLRRFHNTPTLRSIASGDKPEDSNANIPVASAIQIPGLDWAKKDDPPKSQDKHPKKSGVKQTHHKKSSENRDDSDQSQSTRESKEESKPKDGGKLKKGNKKKKGNKPKKNVEGTEDDQPKENSPKKGKGKSTEPRPSTGPGLQQVRHLVEGSRSRSRSKPKPNSGTTEFAHLQGFIQQKHTGYITPEKIKALDIPTPPVPKLSFGLDRVLFNPGVYHLQDPRSRVFNFDPYLGEIMPVTEFDFNTLKEYITSSKDTALRDVAVEHKKKYVGSSSSMTSVLSHFHYLLSNWRPVDTRTISQGFPDKLRSFTRLLRAPAAMFLHYQDGVYAIDADKEFDSANILMNLGKSMEKLLTMPKEEFERYRRSSDNKISVEEELAIPESYHFSSLGDFVMRSQLDAYDPRLPGTGMFDLKTRAVVSIRMDARNYQHGLGYEIKSRFGEFESYEREYFDMIRAAFLKYSLQVRIGRMDGIFVAHHNVERIFGFQYISLGEMDQALHGQSKTALGDAEFQLSLKLWNEILDKATERFPKQSLRFHFETRDAITPFMYVFAEPVTPEEIKDIQSSNAAEVEAYQQRLLHPELFEQEEAFEEPEVERHITSVIFDSDAPPEPMTRQAEEQPNEEVPVPEEEKAKEEVSAPGKEIFAMALSVTNRINGKVVERPNNFNHADEWELEYELKELSPTQGERLYRMCQARRKSCLNVTGEDTQGAASNVYSRRLRNISEDGRKWRARRDQNDKERPTIVYAEEVN